MLNKQYKNNLVNFNSILILFFPIALVSGPLIPEIFLFIIVFSFIYLANSERKFEYFNNNFFKIFLIFFLIVNISSFYNFYSISIKNSIFYFRFGLFSLAIFFFLSENSKLKYQMFISFSVLFFLLFIDSTIQFFFDKNIFGFEKHFTGRVSSFFGDELVLGGFISKFFLFYLALYYTTKLSKNKIYVFIIILTFFFIIFFSAERTALASFILSILFFLILSKSYKLMLKLLIVFSLSIFIFNQFNYSNFKRIFEHTKYQMFNEYNSFNFLSQRHMLHLKTAYKIFQNHMIIGGGPKSFRILCGEDDFIPKQYILDTNTITTKSKGEIDIKVIAYAKTPGGKDINQHINTEEFFEIFNQYRNDLKDLKFNISSPHDAIEKFYNREFSHLRSFATLNYEDGTRKEINFFTPYYYFYIENKFFDQDQKIISFKPLYDNGCNTHPHNFFIQILSEIGILGLSIYIFVGIYILIGLINFLFNINVFHNLYNYKIDLKISLLFASYLVIFFPIFPSGNFFNNWISMILYFPIGFLLNFIDKNKTIKN